MQALTTFLPVIAMLGLGIFARLRALITPEQVGGVKQLVFGLLFPVMIFHALFSSGLPANMVPLVVAVLGVRVILLVAGRIAGRVLGGEQGCLWQYLYPTTDGGNVVFPLYATIVGAQFIGNIVLLDLSAMVIMFLVIPVMIDLERGGSANPGTLLKRMFVNPTVVSMLLGLVLNVAGVYAALIASPVADLYLGVVDMVTGPIVALVLFGIGYDLKIERGSLGNLIAALGLRSVLMGVATVAMIYLFPDQAANREMLIALVLYFICSPGLMLASLLSPLYRDERDAGYVSAFLSLSMVVSLVWYVIVVVVFG